MKKGEGRRRIFVSLEPYYLDCYEEERRKRMGRRRNLVFFGVINCEGGGRGEGGRM